MADTEKSAEDIPKRMTRRQAAQKEEAEVTEAQSQKKVKNVGKNKKDEQEAMETNQNGSKSNENGTSDLQVVDNIKDLNMPTNGKNNISNDEEAMDVDNEASKPAEVEKDGNVSVGNEKEEQDSQRENYAEKETSNDNAVTENGKNNTVPELEGEELTESSPTSKPTLNLVNKTKIKLNIIPKPDDEIMEVPVIKPKIDVIDVPDDETEVVSEDELPPPPSKEKVDGAEEVSDEELPAGPKINTTPPEGAEEVSDEELPEAPAPKPELPPEAEDVSDEELQETKNKSDSKSEPPKEDVTETVIIEDNDGKKEENKTDKSSDRKRSRDESEEPLFPNKDEAKKMRSASPEKVPEKLTQLEQLWKTVKEKSSDFTGWTYLLKYVDQESNVESAEEAYNAFLALYPYCYGYWRKYADFERKKGTQTKCEEVFERGLTAIPLSVDLWVHYLNYVKSVYAGDAEFIRKQYERCVNVCGLEFRADSLWDSYIKWEISEKNLIGAMAIYDRVLDIPLHGTTAHFDSFETFVASHSPKDILSTEHLHELRKEHLKENENNKVEEDKPPGDEDYTPPPEELPTELEPTEVTAIRETIVLEARKKRKETLAAVSERRAFEEGIKRPYFHVKALESCQLKNWKDYLSFEVKKKNEKRIEVLFERCLIACALYEEYWIMYIRHLESRDCPDLAKIGDLFRRACTVHHKTKVNMHLEWAVFKETHDNAEEAQNILQNIEKEHPQLLEISLRRIALEKRRKLNDNVCKLYEKYIEQRSEEKDKKIYYDLAVKYARYSAIVLKEVDKAVEILKKAIETEKESPSVQYFTRFYLQLVDMELHRPQIDIGRIISYLDSMLERTTLTTEQQLTIVTRKLELLEEYGDDIQLINKTIKTFRSLAKQHQSAQESRKLATSSAIQPPEYSEKKEIPTHIISAVRKSKPIPNEAPPLPTGPAPTPQTVFYPGPPTQQQYMAQQPQYAAQQYVQGGVPPPPPNYGGMMYNAPYPSMYGAPQPPNYQGANWAQPGYGPPGYGPPRRY